MPTEAARCIAACVNPIDSWAILDLGLLRLRKVPHHRRLDLPEPTYPLQLRLCEDCLLLQIPALTVPERHSPNPLLFIIFRESGTTREGFCPDAQAAAWADNRVIRGRSREQ